MNPRLTPTDGPLHVVRWVREDGRDVKHHYYRRATDAHAFHAKLIDHGKDPDGVALYTTDVTWTEVTP